MEQQKKTFPVWLNHSLLALVVTLIAVGAYHFLIVKNEKDAFTTNHFAAAHEKALTGLVDAMSMVSLMYNDMKVKEQELKTRLDKLELKQEPETEQPPHD